MEPNKNKKLIDLGILSEDEATGVKKVSLVEEPAIELDFRYFKKEKFVHPSAGEAHDEFINRCIPVLINEGKENDQAVAVCEAYWTEKMAGVKVSFDYHDTLNTERGKELAKKAIADGEDVYVISAGQNKDEFMPIVDELGIDHSKVFATGSNAAKIEKIKELGIQKHYDNNQDVIDELGDLGMKFDINVAGLEPYVDPGVKKKKELDKYEDWSKDSYVVETVLALADQLGTKLEDLHTRFNKEFANASLVGPGINPAIAQNSPYKAITLYKYEGAISDNSRDFCVQMVSRDLFYSREDLVALSNVACNPGFGRGGANEYSIWKFKGGPNCKHAFRKYTVVATENSNSPHIINEGWAPDRPGRKPEDMANSGYISARHSAFKFASDDQMIICGPAMIPSINIPRIDADGERYFVKFSEDTIKEIAMKYFKEARTNDVNTDHEENQAGAYIFESWIVEDPATDKANTIYGYNVPKGSWMLKMKVDNKDTWNRIKAGSLKGFSIEGILMDLEELEARKKYERILNILK